jgi:O-methyltransferase involved in polyketide biosynthesis
VSSDRISPTAHYTGYVWARGGLSHPELATLEGRLLFEALQPAMLASRVAGGPTLESYLRARHRSIDALLERAIEAGQVTQVIEVACGLSPRGWRFVRRYGERLTVYVEADLPGMAARKRAALERMGALSDRHRVCELDVLRDDGRPGSLRAVAAELDEREGLAILTEGLLGYLPGEAVDEIWRRFATTLSAFPTGCYISDIHLGSLATPLVRAFRLMLSVFVRGGVYLHFSGAGEAEAALKDCGFASAHVRRAVDVTGRGDGPGSRLANLLEASTNSSPEAATT